LNGELLRTPHLRLVVNALDLDDSDGSVVAMPLKMTTGSRYLLILAVGKVTSRT
jgi:hypothetical protein